MKKTSKIEIYQGLGGGWYWRLRARNGRITGDGSEDYSSKRAAERGARAAQAAAAMARIVFL